MAGGMELDLRALPAPQPMDRALAAVEALVQGAELVLLTPLMPMPLLQLLDERGFETFASPLREGGARIVVRRP